jgi:putative transposase
VVARACSAVRRRFGYRRLPMLIRREGLIINHKKFRPLHCERGVTIVDRRQTYLDEGNRD